MEPYNRCGGEINEHTTREELIARGFKPEAADEVLAFRDKLRAKAFSRPPHSTEGRS
jgi:hypothetical protein